MIKEAGELRKKITIWSWSDGPPLFDRFARNVLCERDRIEIENVLRVRIV